MKAIKETFFPEEPLVQPNTRTRSYLRKMVFILIPLSHRQNGHPHRRELQPEDLEWISTCQLVEDSAARQWRVSVHLGHAENTAAALASLFHLAAMAQAVEDR